MNESEHKQTSITRTGSPNVKHFCTLHRMCVVGTRLQCNRCPIAARCRQINWEPIVALILRMRALCGVRSLSLTVHRFSACFSLDSS